MNATVLDFHQDATDGGTYAARKITEAAARGDDGDVRYWQIVRDLVDLAPPLDNEQKSALRAALTPVQLAPKRGVSAAHQTA